jgi:two-component system nitrogen regulation response regulator GlnG
MNKDTILVADDDQAIRKVLSQALVRAGYDVQTTASASGLWAMVDSGAGDLVITDVMMPDGNGLDLLPRIRKLRPDLKIIVMSARNTLLTAVKATERGAFEYLPKPFDLNEVLAVVTRALASRDAAPAPTMGGEAYDEALPLIGRSPAMQEVYRILARLMGTELTVMIFGESGTGKELVARALHDYGTRRNGPFVALNMAAIPRELVESELFGHEKGAYTGATSRKAGRFEQAGGGTLFLDEIGDMPLETQTRLLRVLQEGEFTTVGGMSALKADVRIITATHRDLAQLVQQGLFREDLFYRLNVMPLRLPPLRRRKSDIEELARHFLERCGAEGLPQKYFAPAALETLKEYDWPGNVRELENIVRRLVVLTSDEIIPASAVSVELSGLSARDGVSAGELEANRPAFGQSGSLAATVDAHLRRYFSDCGDELPPAGLHERILAEVERPLIQRCLDATGGNQIRAAELLGLNRNTLRKKMKLLGLSSPRSSK